MAESFLTLLRPVLTPAEWERLRWLTQDGRLVPFGGRAEEADGVYLRAEEADLDLLLRAEVLLGQLGWEPPDEDHLSFPTILTYYFERDSQELHLFETSVSRNGFPYRLEAHGEETAVKVDLSDLNDHAYVRAKEVLASIERLAKRSTQGSLPGRLN